ncbi:NAD(P)-dependent dehydrogenase (short-subunit alcohol dehydrogenase family) [Paenibacillus phyllosphaerae]|uniref:NAD(P)-dependent dehydrogenase (Short-subunit alcohol dehydrogenase family) n=1 Tax=Paenibacillus phyllosphaerae TaxID=274593 RepID=A0A7W5FP62_9BACL|nr:SDR family oxidoreductase [Paenibacillus phyllosphaerae]MBB3111719.1 NAD(P)-dependent dehydrogenase (short-subunit alcohol dehydrogenase family) [Paenibacillus phyllosphaerae]
MQFKDQVVIVTGGGSGIGEVAAYRFATEGAYIVIADRDEAGGNRVAERMNEQFDDSDLPVRAIAVRTDVASETDVKSMLGRTIATFGRLDVLLNNAAIIHPGSIEQIEAMDFQRLLDVNLKGVFLTIKHAIPYLRRTQGSIVNVASLGGLTGQANNPIYTASKGAVIAMSKSLALDFAQDGVRINCVCPAGVRTPLLEAWTEQQPDPGRTRQLLGEMHPLGRLAEPEEVADAVLYLASRRASFITGVALPIEGGASLGY